MAFFSDSREILSLFGGYIEEFQELFRVDHVKFGLPDDFPAFAEALGRDTGLGENLAGLARSVMEREKNVSLRSILSIVAIASGGPDLANSSRDMSRPVNLLIDFLISVGGCSTTSAQHPDSPCSDAIDHGMEEAALLTRSSSGAETRPKRVDVSDGLTTSHSLDASDSLKADVQDASNNLVAFEAVDTFADQGSHPGSQGPSHIGDLYSESLTRLELNSLQVKHYLDSIDQRISRMEPRLESLPAFILPAAAPHPRDAADGKFSAAIASESLPHEAQNTPLPSEPPPEYSKPPEQPSRPGTSSPQHPSERRFAVPVIAGLAAVLLASLLYWSLGRNRTLAEHHPVNPEFSENVNTTPSNSAPSPAPDFTMPPGDSSQGATRPQQQSNFTAADDSPGKVGDRPPSNSSPGSRPIRLNASPSSSSVAMTTPSTTPVAVSPPPDSPSHTAFLSTGPSRSTPRHSVSNRIVNVSSGIMAANVLSAPKPSYPKIAILTHMQGEVVIQAIISKEGTIENVHVIKGHRLLRGAATNAVRTWRYRPFLVGGQPVEVATIVSVDFTLPR